ncbi:MAG: NAD-dependent epimerase/dehydratase family protein [Myxococcales bacterium]|nr:NAD-dependent epimerase/dehydratase family protein [Myxococcales bacterium]
MPIARRSILQAAALAPLLVARDPPPRTILVLGGTRFVGRHIVDAALARGHRVTLFNRGRTNPGLFPGVERVLGDRNGDHHELRGRRWDVAVDTSGTEPGPVERACDVLVDAVDRYVYVSSAAAYARDADPYDEDHPLRRAPADGPRNYNENKAHAEAIVGSRFASRRIILRPAVLVGPHDPRHRFVRWPLRAREGGEALAPGAPDDRLPLSDARDLATWLIAQIERATTGTYNVAGPPHTMADLIAAAQRHGAFTPVWIDRPWLAAREVDFDSLPSLHASGYHAMSSARAAALGLRFRSLAASMADVVAWWDAEPRPPHRIAGLTRAREHELLSAWRAG